MRKISLTTKNIWRLLKHSFVIRQNFETKTLLKNDKIPSRDHKVVKILNYLFSNIFNNLDISEHKVDDTLHRDIGRHTILKTS